MAGPSNNGNGTRRPGRPRKEIDMQAVADGAAHLFAEGGYDAVSIEAVAEKLSVSRATLYRTVPTKDDLMGILLERTTDELSRAANALVAEHRDPADELPALVRLHVAAAIKTRDHMAAVFFGAPGLTSDVHARWRKFRRAYETVWVGVVTRAIEGGILPPSDPVLTTRLLLGMVIWVSRWYQPREPYNVDKIAEAVVALVKHDTAAVA
jgi:AcrR family transcriptional regulator